MPTVTLSELRENVYTRLEGNTVLYTDDEVDDSINDAIGTVQLLTGFGQTRVTHDYTTRRGRPFYQVPYSLLVVTAVYLEEQPLFKSSLSQKCSADMGWLRRPASASRQPSEWTPLGIRLIAISPAPWIDGQQITMTGIAEPTPLVNDTDVISLKDEHVELVTLLASHTPIAKIGGLEFANSGTIYKDFLARAKKLRRFQSFKNPRWDTEAAVRAS